MDTDKLSTHLTVSIRKSTIWIAPCIPKERSVLRYKRQMSPEM